MKNIELESKLFFESLSRDEFIEFLTDAGYGVIEGDGEIVYEDTIEFSLHAKIERIGYKNSENKLTSVNAFPIAC